MGKYTPNNQYLFRYKNAFLKIARTFSTNYYGVLIPKNALYGRLKSGKCVCVEDFAQFAEKLEKYTILEICDGRKRRISIKHGGDAYYTIVHVIRKNELFGTECIHQLGLSRIAKPEARTVPQSIYKASPRQLPDSKSALYECGITDTDAIRSYAFPHGDINKNSAEYRKNLDTRVSTSAALIAGKCREKVAAYKRSQNT